MGWNSVDGRKIFTMDAPVAIPDNTGALQQEFDAACEKFREVCAEIGALIGNPQFRGGFDEMAEFEASAASQTEAGVALAIKWMAADKLCTYLGSKIGLHQPQWWHECWMTADTTAELPDEKEV